MQRQPVFMYKNTESVYTLLCIDSVIQKFNATPLKIPTIEKQSKTDF